MDEREREREEVGDMMDLRRATLSVDGTRCALVFKQENFVLEVTVTVRFHDEDKSDRKSML